MWPGARTPPTEPLNSVSPVKTSVPPIEQRQHPGGVPGGVDRLDLERAADDRGARAPSCRWRRRPARARAGGSAPRACGWRSRTWSSSATWSWWWWVSSTCVSCEAHPVEHVEQRLHRARRRRSSRRGTRARRPPGRCSTATVVHRALDDHRPRGVPVGWAHEPDPHLLPDHRHRPLGRVLQRARLQRERPDADPRRGDQRVHGTARRRPRAAARADLQLRRGAATRSAPATATSRSPPPDLDGALAQLASRGSSPSARRTASAKAARGCASCATPTATGSS